MAAVAPRAALRQGRWQPPLSRAAQAISLSVVIPTRDRPEELRRCIHSLLLQRPLPREVIVVDNGTQGDGGVGDALRQAGIRYLYLKLPAGHLTAARNLGARHASGEVILFLDDDVVLEPDYLANILSVYGGDTKREIGGVGGVDLNTPPPRRLLRLLLFDSKKRGKILPSACCAHLLPGDSPARVECLSGCNMSFRREVLEDMRFNETFGGFGLFEDVEFTARVAKKYALVAVPTARVRHLRSPRSRPPSVEHGFNEIYLRLWCFRRVLRGTFPNTLNLLWVCLVLSAGNLLLSLSEPRRFLRFVGNVKGFLEFTRGWRRKLWTASPTQSS